MVGWLDIKKLARGLEGMCMLLYRKGKEVFIEYKMCIHCVEEKG